MKKGFTLIELSIVLVVIGLLIGGILVAQTMINSSQLNRTVSELQQYGILVGTFKGKFGEFPGDLNTQILGGSETYGNNDGQIVKSGADDVASTTETHHAWRHLYVAGMIKEDGSPKCSFSEAEAECNYWINYMGNTGVVPDNEVGNYIKTCAGTRCTGNDSSLLFTDAEAYAIDKKIDDGRTKYGLIKGRNEISGGGTVGYCGGAWSYLSSAYDPSNSNRRCQVWYWVKEDRIIQ